MSTNTYFDSSDQNLSITSLTFKPGSHTRDWNATRPRLEVVTNQHLESARIAAESHSNLKCEPGYSDVKNIATYR